MASSTTVFTSLKDVCDTLGYHIDISDLGKHEAEILDIFNGGNSGNSGNSGNDGNGDLTQLSHVVKVWLGHYYYQLGKVTEMKKLYHCAIKMLKDPLAMNNMGRYYESIKNHTKMIHYYKMAIAHGSSDAMVNLGHHYSSKSKNFGDEYGNMSVDLYVNALSLGNPVGAASLANYYLQMGMKEKSVKYAQLAANADSLYGPYDSAYYSVVTEEKGIELYKQFIVLGGKELERLKTIKLRHPGTTFLAQQIDKLKSFCAYSAATIGTHCYVFDPQSALKYFTAARQFNECDAIISYNIACTYQLLDESENAKQHFVESFKGGYTKAMEKLKTITDDVELYILIKKNNLHYAGVVTDAIQIYENKLLLTTTEECGVCLTEGTCVLTSCFRHRVCTDCYGKCYKICPFCRIKNS